MVFRDHCKNHQFGRFFLGRVLIPCGGLMNIIDREFTWFVFILKILTPVSVDLHLNLSFFGYCHCNNSIVHQISTSDFQVLVDRESHSQLFVSFSVQENKVKGVVFVFFNGVCFLFLNSADINFFRVKTTWMSLSFGITSRTFQDPMLNNLEEAIVRGLGI